MNRLVATLVVFSMILLAIGITIRHTLAAGGAGTGRIVVLSIFALLVIAAAAILVKRHLTMHHEVLTRSRAVVARPLRRLLSTVWS